MVILIIALLFISPVAHSNCVGQSCTRIYDEFCTQTNSECGHNMVYKTVERLIYTDEILNLETCIQECKCISDEYVQTDGQCIKQKSLPMQNGIEKMRKIPADKQGNLQRISEILPKYCAGRLCALDEKIFDPLCLLTGGKCGKNMVFKTVYRTLRMGMSSMLSLTFCIQQCTCVNKYVKKDGQCIKQNSFPVRNETEFRAEILPKRCTGRECALDEEISDVSCSLTGKMCGTNMIFDKVGKSNETNGTNGTICVQKCTCMSEEYVKANGQCILSAKGKKTATLISTQQTTDVPQFPMRQTAQKIGAEAKARKFISKIGNEKFRKNFFPYFSSID